MNGCVYRTEDNKCEFYSDYGKGIVSYCDFDDCEDKKPSNADRIRAMTDEELAEFMNCGACPPGKDVSELCHDEDGGSVPDMCNICWLCWLKEEAT